VLLQLTCLKRERSSEESSSFYNFSGGVFDQICDQGSGYTTPCPSSNLCDRLCTPAPVRRRSRLLTLIDPIL
jgi:hypothetical protein